MAVKVPGFARLLVALTLLAWGQFSFAENFYWAGVLSNESAYGSSPVSACKAVLSKVSKKEGVTLYYGWIDYSGATAVNCFYSGNNPPTQYFRFGVFRYGDSCPSGSTYNESTGECLGSKDCSSTAGKEIRKSQVCQYNKATKLADCESQIAFEGCKYTGSGGKSCSFNDAGQYICTGSYYGSGEDNGTAEDTCSGESCKPVDASEPNTNCVKSNGIEMCFDPKNPGCGTINGKEGCFQEKPGCGVFNGTYQCVDNDKPSRNCAYFNGKQVCFDPKDPTKVIPDTSSDHPANGGNADGDDTNDPRPSGGTGGSSQGSNAGATNQAINDLGEKLGPKIDKTNSLLDGISQKFDELTEGLFGDQLKDSDMGVDGEAKQAGEQAAAGLPGIFNEEQEKIQKQRDEEADSYLKGLPHKVEKEWFGVNGELVGLNNVLDKILPTAMGCADYRIPLFLDSNNATLVIPVCQLTRVKPLLEWVIWTITLIGLWKIFYSALRQEDVKAAKGGF